MNSADVFSLEFDMLTRTSALAKTLEWFRGNALAPSTHQSSQSIRPRSSSLICNASTTEAKTPALRQVLKNGPARRVRECMEYGVKFRGVLFNHAV